MSRPARNEQVLDAAAELFARGGYAATSIREVAAKANLTKAGLYYHFREKDELLERICVWSIETIVAGARRALAEHATPRRRLAALIRNHTGFFFDHPHNLVVLNRDRQALPPVQRARIAALERVYLDLIRDVIGEYQRDGVFRTIDPTVAAFTLLGALNTLDRWYRPSGKVAPPELVASLETIFCDGLEAAADGKGAHNE